MVSLLPISVNLKLSNPNLLKASIQTTVLCYSTYYKQKMLPTLGAHSFAAVAPVLWNKLHVYVPAADVGNVASLNGFKKLIKTSLFNKSI